jgi:hypothetical protein
MPLGNGVTSATQARRARAQLQSRKADSMAFERLKAEISLLVTQMENQPDDKHEIYLQLREKLNEMRVTGMPLPEDLLQLERRLEAEFNAAK